VHRPNDFRVRQRLGDDDHTVDVAAPRMVVAERNGAREVEADDATGQTESTSERYCEVIASTSLGKSFTDWRRTG
jgi:hypothetical protein